MAMIKCTECGKEMSDKATVCPNCGCPIEEIKAKLGEIESEREEKLKAKEEDGFVCMPYLIHQLLYLI